MIIDKDILLDAMLLLVHVNTSTVRSLITELLQYYKDNNIHQDHIEDPVKIFEQIIVSNIKDIIKLKLCKDHHDRELKMIFNKIQTNDIFKKYPEWLSYLHDILNTDVTLNQDIIEHINNKITNIVVWFRCNQQLKKMYGKLNNLNIKSSSDDTESLYKEILDISNSISHSIRNSKDVSDLAVERIRLSNEEDIKKAFEKYKERNVTGVIKAGLQGLNNMCGSRKGFGLGKSVVFCALTHNYKSTMLLSIARWIKDYNSFPIKNGKKPLIPFISLENESYENMMLWFKHAAKILLKDEQIQNIKNDDEYIEMIKDYFHSKNIEIDILRYLPEDFGYEELVELITQYEEDGYYIPACIIDYLRQMRLYNKGENVSKRGSHTLIKELFNKVCNYLKSKGITLFTGHQLNRDASKLASTVPYPVKRFNEAYLEGSTDVGREVDMIIYMHLEKNHNGQRFLTLQWGKHRYEEDTPEKYKFIAYPFIDGKGIVDDINGKFGGVKDIYGYTSEENNENNNNGNQNIELETNY